jgi:hypothetical protein
MKSPFGTCWHQKAVLRQGCGMRRSQALPPRSTDVPESGATTVKTERSKKKWCYGVDQQHMALLVDMWSTTRRQVRLQPTLNVSE